MKKHNEQFEKNIARLVKSTGEQQIPSENFTNTLIKEALKELPDNQPSRQKRSKIMKPQIKKLIGIAASIIIVVSLGVMLLNNLKTPVENTSIKPSVMTPENGIPIPLELPESMFVGSPKNLSGVENLEPDTKQSRPPFYAPAGVSNLALNKPISSSEMDPITGSLDMIVDGDKEATEGSVVELGPFKQWVVIDLEEEYEIYAIVFWHFHKTARVYNDIVVQLSNDSEFITDVTTLFNNDHDNTLGMGVGPDKNYIDKAEGKLIDAKGTKARYVRLFSQGNSQNDYSHYIEVEVWGCSTQ